MKQNVTILGSTGSIGTQALDVCAALPEQFNVFALCAGSNLELLYEQANRFHPRYVSATKPLDSTRLPHDTCIVEDLDAPSLLAAHTKTDIVVAGISGIAQLKSLLAALQADKRVALANKESIVCGHELVNAALASGKGLLLPVDSEQSAIFQCLQKGAISHVLLTCSGGPFWRLPKEELLSITMEQALHHPTWRMGRKITIDSATLFNKGLELIEACYLFDLPPEKIHVVIHPQSIVHSAVAYEDGTILANVSYPDMRLPIQYAMTYPERLPGPAKKLTFENLCNMEFHPADRTRFGALQLAFDAAKRGGSLPIVFNGANEAAVAMLFEGKLRFHQIEQAVQYAMEHCPYTRPNTIEEILQVDADARRLVTAFIQEGGDLA